MNILFLTEDEDLSKEVEKVQQGAQVSWYRCLSYLLARIPEKKEKKSQIIFHEFDTMNKEWHSKHRMPKNASLEEKIKWHTEHAKYCDCRDSSAHLLKLKAKSGNKK